MIDVDVARTFLTVAETSSFQLAAQRLNVTQSTISARIRVLEERLGRRLFERSRMGAALTAHGRAFKRYAAAIVHAWEEGRRMAASDAVGGDRLAVGGEHDLWARMLAQWLLELSAQFPAGRLTAVAADVENLMEGIRQLRLDLAVMHKCPDADDLSAEQLMEDEHVLVTTDPSGVFHDRYVEIVWPLDAESVAQRDRFISEPARTRINLGFSTISYLVISQGAGYLPRRLVDPYIDAGHFHVVEDAPVFHSSVYLVRRAEEESAAMKQATDILKDVARLADRGELPPPFWSGVH
ncbi:MAG TPA: LysR family transcriptional regulator [Hyphomonadaceae bacterium]|nr:LysR family transcriptional regulator [Hyphomonadaceae bacterium]